MAKKPTHPTLRFSAGVGLIPVAITLFLKDLPWMTTQHWGLILGWVAFSLLAFPALSKKKWWAWILLLLAAIFTTFWIPNILLKKKIEAQIPQATEKKTSIADKVFLYERYGGEWQTSNREPILFRNSEAVLRSKFAEGKDYRFTPMVYNSSKTVTLIEPVELYISIPSEISVSKPKLWRISDSDSEFVQFTAIIPLGIPPGTSNSLNESLFLRFLKPGRYRATYSIHGTTATGEGVTTDRRAFCFELTP